jgi:hypothetical protein
MSQFKRSLGRLLERKVGETIDVIGGYAKNHSADT